MLSIVDNKNIDFSIMFGNGKKDGEVKPWLNKDPVEQEEQLMDIVIDCTVPLFMQILWKIFLHLKF
jgi:hypothetical protein